MEPLVAAYERALVRRHAMELQPLALCVERVMVDADALERRLSDGEGGARRSLQAQLPLFFGLEETRAFVAACRSFLAAVEAEEHAELKRIKSALERHVEELEKESKAAAPVTSLLTDKRNFFVGFLKDAGQLLEQSHAHQLTQSQDSMVDLMESYRRALLDPVLSKRKQLEFELSSIETSALTMLLAHIEICRTIRTANAEVNKVGRFSAIERERIEAFVNTAMGLKDRKVDFASVVARSGAFVQELELFERAASKDAFVVCSTALKLQFQESIDKDMFQAYLSDWSTKHSSMESLLKSAEYTDAMDHAASLKHQIKALDQQIRDRKANVAADEPTRAALVGEVERLFKVEGASARGLQVL